MNDALKRTSNISLFTGLALLIISTGASEVIAAFNQPNLWDPSTWTLYPRHAGNAILSTATAAAGTFIAIGFGLAIYANQSFSGNRAAAQNTSGSSQTNA